MGLFRRAKPLHQRLAEEGALEIGAPPMPAPRDAALVGDLFGDPGPPGEVGLHGVPRRRRWDAVARVEAKLPGEAVHFVALPDGTLIVDEDVPDDALGPLADAIEQTIPPPYRAHGVRQGQSSWAVAATRIEVREIAGHEGEDELELVDGDEVVLGRRLDGDLWEVEVSRL